MTGLPWELLTSAQRLDAVLLAIDELEDVDATASEIATQVGFKHAMAQPRDGKRTNRVMSMAVRVTPAVTALRKRGLISFGPRMDGYTGTADVLTKAGTEHVAELRAK